MANTQASGIQTIIDTYVAAVGALNPGVQMGVVAGFVTPDTPSGTVVASSATVTSQGKSTITLSGSTPFELGSVSKLFTVGIHHMLHSNFSGTLGDRLGDTMTMSSLVKSIPIKCLAGYASGFPQDNGICPCHTGQPYPPKTTDTLVLLFEYLSKFSTPAYTPGTKYSYSNLAMSLLSMAALELDSLDTDAFGTAYNTALIQYCQTFGVDPVGSTSTIVYNQVSASSLPAGYDQYYQQKTAQPCSIVKYGSGGIVSTGDDMLKFLLYAMSAAYPVFMQEYQWQHQAYCLKEGELGPMNGLGWFLREQEIKGQSLKIGSKDGGVTGFSSWIGFEQRPDPSSAAPRGVFVLTNGYEAVELGTQIFEYLVPPLTASATGKTAPFPAFSGDPGVH